MIAKKIAMLLLPVAAFALIACSEKSTPVTEAANTEVSESTKSAAAEPANTEISESTRPAVAPMLVATIQDLMKHEIDPAADYLWDSVSTVSTSVGVVENRPRTDEDWQTARNQAVKLIEATNLLMMPGRKVMEEGGRLDYEEIEENLSAAEIQQLIDKDPAAFAAMSSGLQAAVQNALTAIEARDADALFEAGGPIDTACEACHRVYWYPGFYPDSK
jgi:redox-regulated HSP33 family molecular chaperone